MEGRGAALPGWTVTESHLLLSDAAFYHLVASLNQRQTTIFNSAIKVAKDCPVGRPHSPNKHTNEHLDALRAADDAAMRAAVESGVEGAVEAAQKAAAEGAVERTKQLRQLMIFVSGGAGSGKSCLLTAIRQALLRHYLRMVPASDISTYDTQHNCPHVLLMAYTGAAAFNVHGETLHGGLHVGGRQEGGTWNTIFSESHLADLRAAYKHLKCVMIDEASMLSNRCLESIDALFRQILDKTRPFGGLHVLFFGDLFQLQPVADFYVFEPLWNQLEGIFKPSPWEHVTLFELTEIMRQREDLQYAESMNRLRCDCTLLRTNYYTMLKMYVIKTYMLTGISYFRFKHALDNPLLDLELLIVAQKTRRTKFRY